MHLIIILQSGKKEELKITMKRTEIQDEIHLDFRFGSSHVASKNYGCQADKIKICYFYTLNRCDMLGVCRVHTERQQQNIQRMKFHWNRRRVHGRGERSTPRFISAFFCRSFVRLSSLAKEIIWIVLNIISDR